MKDSTLQFLFWAGGIAISIAQVMAGLLLKRLWNQVDQNTEKAESNRVALYNLQMSISEKHPTHLDVKDALRSIEKQIETSLKGFEREVRELKDQQTRLFDKLDNKQDKK